MATSTLTSKGQITLPKMVREHLGLDAGDRINFVIRESGEVVVEPETVDVRSLRSALKRKGPGVSLAEMDRAIRRGVTGK